MKQVKLYYSTDVHGYLFPTNYISNEEMNMGILKFSSLINKDGNTLVIDGGDTIQGSPLTTYLVKSPKEWSNHPIAEVFNQLGYDYITLGNHDFNYGENYLLNYLSSLNALPLSSNIIYKTNPNSLLPYDIKTLENGIKVGIIGATTSHITIWEHKKNIVNFEINDPLTSIKETLKLIKNRVDLTIVVYHGGFERDIKTGELLGKDTGENQAYQIAKECDIDLLLTGHQHLKIAGQTIHGTYILQNLPNAFELSEIRLNYTDHWEISSSFLTPKKIEARFYTSKIKELENKLETWLDQPVGHFSHPIIPKSHLEMAISGNQLTTFLNKIQLEATSADISCTSLANHIKGFEKAVTIRDIVSTYIYPNTLVVLDVTGNIIRKALERSAAYFSLQDDQLVVSETFLKPKIEHYNYDYFYGISYTMNIKNPINQRVVSVTINGKEINDDDHFTLVMNNYRASGTGGYEFYQNQKVVKEVLIDTQELVINYFMKHKNISLDEKNNFHIIY